MRNDPRAVEVVLGEVNVETDPDCEGKGKVRKCAPPVQKV